MSIFACSVALQVRRVLLRAMPLALLAGFATPGKALAQDNELVGSSALPGDPCSERLCRALSRDERAAFGRILAALIAALPPPSKATYEQSGLRSIQGLGNSLVTDECLRSPAFPGNVVDPMGVSTDDGVFPRSLALAFSYVRKDKRETGVGFYPTGNGEMEIYDLRIEVCGQAGPVFVKPSSAARIIDSSASSFTWEEPLPDEGGTMLLVTSVLGEYTRDPASSIVAGGATEKLAPLRAVRVSIQGRPVEARELLKKLDRKAIRALIVRRKRKPGAARNRGAQ